MPQVEAVRGGNDGLRRVVPRGCRVLNRSRVQQRLSRRDPPANAPIGRRRRLRRPVFTLEQERVLIPGGKEQQLGHIGKDRLWQRVHIDRPPDACRLCTRLVKPRGTAQKGCCRRIARGECCCPRRLRPIVDLPDEIRHVAAARRAPPLGTAARTRCRTAHKQLWRRCERPRGCLVCITL